MLSAKLGPKVTPYSCIYTQYIYIYCSKSARLHEEPELAEDPEEADVPDLEEEREKLREVQ